MPTEAEGSGPLAPVISVVICTRDRTDTIARAIESVAEQTYSKFEILVVDQSRTDQTRHIVEALMQRYSYLRYIHLDRAGLSRAYNHGIRGTASQWLAFTDDDCVVPPNWLDTVARIFAEQVDVSMIYGQVLAPDELRTRHANGDGVTPTLPIHARRRLSVREGFMVFGMGANFAIRRNCWERIGGFDEVLGGGGPLKSSQDYDFAYRVVQSGGTILLEPDLIAYHYGFRPHSEWPATLRAYGVGDGAFYFKHVRSGDLYVTWLLSRLLVHQSLRVAKHALLRPGDRGPWLYFSHVVRGMRDSLRYGVDREQRLYRTRKSA